MEHRHLTEPLEASEEWFRCIFDGSRDAIFIVCEDTQTVSDLGFTNADLEGKTLWESLPTGISTEPPLQVI